MEIWACEKSDEDGRSYLRSALDVRCDTKSPIYARLLSFSIVFFLIYFFGIQSGLSLAASSDDYDIRDSIAGGI